MNAASLASLLSLAVASHKSGNVEDSHGLFDAFVQEATAMESSDAADTKLLMSDVVLAAFVASEERGEEAVEPAVESTAGIVTDLIDDDDAAAETGSVFDQNSDFSEEDASEAVLAAHENSEEDDIVIASNLAFLGR